MAADLVVMESVKAGEREDIPAAVPKPLAELIARCWAQDPGKRPTMNLVVEALQALVPEDGHGISDAAPGPKTQLLNRILNAAERGAEYASLVNAVTHNSYSCPVLASRSRPLLLRVTLACCRYLSTLRFGLISLDFTLCHADCRLPLQPLRR